MKQGVPAKLGEWKRDRTMTVQVLVAAMNQTDRTLLDSMNIQSDAIIGNQCERNSIEAFLWQGYQIKYLNFAETGVGLNRNNALMRADGDICLFADDDMRYCNGYVDTVKNAFQSVPAADVIIFNLIEPVPTRYVIKKTTRVTYLNFLRYGAARIAVQNKSVQQAGIFFNQCFGGGTAYSHGEDSLFLADCLKKGLKVYAVPQYIAELCESRASSWDHGYDEKYLKDQGVLYRTMSRHFWKLLCLQDAVRHRNEYKCGWVEAYKLMRNK